MDQLDSMYSFVEFVKKNIRSQLRFISGILFLFFLTSCGSDNRRGETTDFFAATKFDEDDFADALSEVYKLDIDDSIWGKKKMRPVSEVAKYIYRQSEYLPLWVTEKGNTDVVEALLKDIETLKEDGLNPERYNYAQINNLVKKFKDSKDDVGAVVALDTACTSSYLQAAHDLLFGAVKPRDADSLWFHANDSAWRPDTLLVNVLFRQGVYPSLRSFRSNIPTYKLLLQAKKHYSELAKDSALAHVKKEVLVNKKLRDSLIRVIIRKELPFTAGSGNDSDGNEIKLLVTSFQSYYGLNPNGKIDTNLLKHLARQPLSVLPQIDANLERLRWMPKELEPTHVLVDIPLEELYLRNNGSTAMRMRVVVGKTERQTPSLNANMANIVFNPSWGVPPTIMKKDVLPGMAKSGTAYLDKKDLKVYDHKGNRVNPAIVNAANYKRFVFRQPPGDDNALGFVKFNLPNKFDIYLHDTPHRELFDNYDRAQSSGCVRVQQPREMAVYILSEIDKRNFDQLDIDSLIRTEQTKQVELKTKIPVHIVYLTAFQDDAGRYARFTKDIYHRDMKLAALLK
jgi:murein L,D-transpeptidase YcbB/YkuD